MAERLLRRNASEDCVWLRYRLARPLNALTFRRHHRAMSAPSCEPTTPARALRSKLPKTSLRAVGRVLEVALSLECGEDVAVPGGVGIGHRGLHRRLGRGNNLELHGHALVRAAGTDDEVIARNRVA